MKIAIVGSGNVADAIVHAIAGNPTAHGRAKIAQICARNEAEGRRLAAVAGAEYVPSPDMLAAADLYLLAVSDSAIGALAAQINAAKDAVIAHTAGSIGINVLPEQTSRAVFYPLQTFTKGRKLDTRTIPVFIEYSSPHAGEVIQGFARFFSDNVREADSQTRAWMHLTAVFAGNFTNHMYAVAERILKEHDLPFDVLKPLITEIASKAVAADSPAAMQTGPAIRGDMVTQKRHIEMLSAGGEKELKKIYETISKDIWQISKK